METTDARAEAAAALRRLGHTMIGREADDDLLLRVAAAADRTTELLEQAPARVRDYVGMKHAMFPSNVAPTEEQISHFPECFVSGVHNPMGIGIHVYRTGDASVRAHVELGAAFEGAPGRSHGGIVAAVFDDVLGYVLTVIDQPAFTGELTVRYLAPTPIHQPLTFDAKLDSRDGRKLYMSAEARMQDGRLAATATATFIAVDPATFKP
jgi:acyl-coenzyme A thioesterase PaaI-like protein